MQNFILIRIFARFPRYYNAPSGNFQRSSSFQDSRKNKKGERKQEEKRQANYRVQELRKAPISARQTSIIVPEEAFVSASEAGSGGLRLASRFLISASKQGASDFPSIERGCLWDRLTTSRHCISRTVRGRLDEFGRTAVQSA